MVRTVSCLSFFFVLAGCGGDSPCPDGWVEGAAVGSCEASAETVAAIEGRIGSMGAYGFVRITSSRTSGAGPNRTVISYPENREVQIYETHSGGACRAAESLVATPLTDATGTWAAALGAGLHCAVFMDPASALSERIDFSVGEGLVEADGFDLTEEL